MTVRLYHAEKFYTQSNVDVQLLIDVTQRLYLFFSLDEYVLEFHSLNCFINKANFNNIISTITKCYFLYYIFTTSGI